MSNEQDELEDKDIRELTDEDLAALVDRVNYDEVFTPEDLTNLPPVPDTELKALLLLSASMEEVPVYNVNLVILIRYVLAYRLLTGQKPPDKKPE